MSKRQNLTATLVVASAALMLSACDKPQPTDTLQSLMADPARLRSLREQCKTERSKLGDQLCDQVAEATTEIFWGRQGAVHPSQGISQVLNASSLLRAITPPSQVSIMLSTSTSKATTRGSKL